MNELAILQKIRAMDTKHELLGYTYKNKHLIMVICPRCSITVSVNNFYYHTKTDRCKKGVRGKNLENTERKKKEQISNGEIPNKQCNRCKCKRLPSQFIGRNEKILKSCIKCRNYIKKWVKNRQSTV